MAYRNTSTVSLLVLGIGSVMTFAQSMPPICKPAKDRYELALKTLLATHKKTLDDAETAKASQIAKNTERQKEASKELLGKIDEFLKDAKSKGDLDTVLLFQEFKTQFERNSQADSSKLPMAARMVHEEYQKLIAKLDAETLAGPMKVYADTLEVARNQYETKAREAHEAFLSELEELVRSETKVDKIESAKSIREYRTSVKDYSTRLLQPVLPVFDSRKPENRAKYVMMHGGNNESEAAVARGLVWLAGQQRANGSWVFDGSSAADTCAATAMALLPFLAVGQTHKPAKGNTYQETVKKGVDYLISLEKKPVGGFRTSSNMYSHAIAALALCELTVLTEDKVILEHAKLAINYIVKAQGANGSWGYQSGQDGDTSIIGWQIQALKCAELCKGISIPKSTQENAAKFLESVTKGPFKEQFGYRDNEGARPGTSLTAVGLYCRSSMGWNSKNEGLKKGIEGLVKMAPPVEDPARYNMYYYYYATRVVQNGGGDAWMNDWNPKMRDILVKKQVPQNKPQNIKGSWDPDQATIGSHCGRLGTSCMSLLTLEVYYRYPVTKSE